MSKYNCIVISSGFYNPIHHGHIAYLKAAKNCRPGAYHIAIVNNDRQAVMKKGRVIIPLKDRLAVVEALSCVDEAFVSIDEDDSSVCASIISVSKKYLKDGIKVYFVKGGDRFKREIPEYEICRKWNITIIDRIVPQLQQSRNLIK